MTTQPNLRHAALFSLSLLVLAAACTGSLGESTEEPEPEQSSPPITDTTPAPVEPDDDGTRDPNPPACDDGVATSEIRATAPWSVGDHHLGRPVDQDFETIPGEQGASLFEARDTHDTNVDVVDHQFFMVDNSLDLKANGSAWGISVTAEVAASKRFASFRAYQVDFVREIEDGAAYATPPAGAAYYVSRIYYGHSFEVVVSGDRKKFHAGVRARFAQGSGSIEVFASQNSLETSVFGRGLEPRDGDALFAQTAEEIQQAYSAAGDPVPIFVDYKRIPGACAGESEDYLWDDFTAVTVSYDTVEIYRDGSIGQDDWSLDASCKINGTEITLDDPVVWNHRTGVNSHCSNGSGPNGDDDYCSYPTNWSAQLEVVEGDDLRCGITGIAHHDNHIIPFSEFSYIVQAQNTPISDRFGAGDGDTEYWLNYSLSFQDP